MSQVDLSDQWLFVELDLEESGADVDLRMPLDSLVYLLGESHQSLQVVRTLEWLRIKRQPE